jgi:beta-glucosidase
MRGQHHRNIQKFHLRFTKADFGKFSWGVAIASFQNEGAWNIHGRGMSIWDTFTTKRRKISDGSNAQIAADFYHRYKEDIDLVKSMGFDSFRFSLSWSRIIPDGNGQVNPAGIEFYNRVIDYCLLKGLEPWVMLYHWDLPQALEDAGGWTNRDIVDWFSHYAGVCADAFGDRVKYWMVMNEPVGFTSLGYFLGKHAPGKRGISNFLPAVHHAALCQAGGGRVLRAKIPDAIIGTTFSCSSVKPVNDKKIHREAARRINALLNRLFIEPSLGMGYPVDALGFLKRIEKYILPGDREKLAFDFDFIGLQNYFSVVGKQAMIPYMWATQVKPDPTQSELTAMNWEVDPEGMYDIIKQFSAYPVRSIVITENGASFTDVIENEEINDDKRVSYFERYLQQIIRAKRDGYKVDGYFVWTLTDNFEWAEGYSQRFGLVYTDFITQKRIPKKSAFWFKSFLKSAGE